MTHFVKQLLCIAIVGVLPLVAVTSGAADLTAMVTLARDLQGEITDDTLSIDLHDGSSVRFPLAGIPLANGKPKVLPVRDG